MRVCLKKIRLVCAIACVPVRYICLCNCVLVSRRGRRTIFIQQLPQRGSQKQVRGHDRDRATAAFCCCNRKLIETINTVLIIKAQVLRWHFADCYSAGSPRKLQQQMSDLLLFRPPPSQKSRCWGITNAEVDEKEKKQPRKQEASVQESSDWLVANVRHFTGTPPPSEESDICLLAL